MKFTKKMKLVECNDDADQPQQNGKCINNMSDESYSKSYKLYDLDQMMSKILKLNLPDNEKWRLYFQILQRFLFFTKQVHEKNNERVQKYPVAFEVQGKEPEAMDARNLSLLDCDKSDHIDLNEAFSMPSPTSSSSSDEAAPSDLRRPTKEKEKRKVPFKSKFKILRSPSLPEKRLYTYGTFAAPKDKKQTEKKTAALGAWVSANIS